jgi:hypothetical protein
MTNLLITYISLSCLCLISLFIHFFKSRLFTFHICFQFRVQDHLTFKLMRRTCTNSDLDVLLYVWKDKEIQFSTQLVSWSTKIGVSPQSSKQNCLIVPTSMQYFLSINHSRLNYSPTWCTHKHVTISFHNELMTNLATTCIFLSSLCPINKKNSKYLFTTIPWRLKNQFVLQHYELIWWDFIDKGSAFFIIHVCNLLNYYFLTNLCYCSVLYIIQGHYSPIVRAHV